MTIRKKIGALCLIIGTCYNSTAQNIYTFAGTGAPNFSGDGGPAISADIYYPSAVYVDAIGNVLVTSIGDNRLRKIDVVGIISTLAGTGATSSVGDGGPATAAGLFTPKGVTVDGAGNIYIADANNNRIRQINTSGTITTIAGTGMASYGGDGGPATSAWIKHPNGVSVDIAGNIYISDEGNNRIRMVNSSGAMTTIAGTGGAAYAGDGGPAASAQLAFPSAVKTDAAGNVYIADYNHHCIRKINLAGSISTIAGTGVAGHSGDNGPATSAQLNLPTDLVLDASGNIFITEQPGYVRKISTIGTISTIAGTGTSGYSGDGGPALSAQLNVPVGIALDSSGNIYLADNSNHRIRVICMSNCPLGIEENSISNGLKIFPNPASSILTISSEQNTFENSEIEITNYLGQSVLKLPFTKTVDVANLAQGMYTVKISSAKGQTLTKKFVKD